MKDQPRWKYLQMFEDHCEVFYLYAPKLSPRDVMTLFYQDRKLTQVWQEDNAGIVEQIREKWEMHQFSAEEIQRVEGILDVNTLELVEEKFDDSKVTTPRHSRTFCLFLKKPTFFGSFLKNE